MFAEILLKCYRNYFRYTYEEMPAENLAETTWYFRAHFSRLSDDCLLLRLSPLYIYVVIIMKLLFTKG